MFPRGFDLVPLPPTLNTSARSHSDFLVPMSIHSARRYTYYTFRLTLFLFFSSLRRPRGGCTFASKRAGGPGHEFRERAILQQVKEIDRNGTSAICVGLQLPGFHCRDVGYHQNTKMNIDLFFLSLGINTFVSVSYY
jgi:hypothetical protein